MIERIDVNVRTVLPTGVRRLIADEILGLDPVRGLLRREVVVTLDVKLPERPIGTAVSHFTDRQVRLTDVHNNRRRGNRG